MTTSIESLAELHGIVKQSNPPPAAMHVGEITERPPTRVLEATQAAIQNDPLGYTESQGYQPLREEIANDMTTRKGIICAAQDILVVPGVKQGLFYLFHHLLEPGDEVILPTPHWSIYDSQIRHHGGVPVHTPLSWTGLLDLKHLEKCITPRTKVLVLCSPHNPTGTILPRPHLRDIAALLEDHPNITILSDEIYEHLDYNGLHTAVASLDTLKDRTYTLGGFSKSHCMTGYRLGYIIRTSSERTSSEKTTHSDITQLTKLQSIICTCPSTIAQHTALRLYRMEYLEQEGVLQRNMLDRRRIELVEAFKTCPYYLPTGAFYFFYKPKCPNNDDRAYCTALLEQGVAVAPGSFFGKPGYIRVSYACSEADFRRGLQQLKMSLQE